MLPKYDAQLMAVDQMEQDAIAIVAAANSSVDQRFEAVARLSTLGTPRSRAQIDLMLNPRPGALPPVLEKLGGGIAHRLQDPRLGGTETSKAYVEFAAAFRQKAPDGESTLGRRPEDPELYCLEADDKALWAIVRSSRFDPIFRAHALKELSDRKFKELPAFVEAELKKPNLAPSWRDALVASAARIQFISDEQRQSVANSLWTVALSLCQGEDRDREGTLWRAIRRYATLRPQADVSKLAELVPCTEGYLPFRHVLLLSIINAFAAWPPTAAEQARLSKLRAWVVDVARTSLQRHSDESANQEAIAQCSLVAAAALSVPELNALCEQAKGHEESWLIAMAQEDMVAMLKRWQQRNIQDEGERSALSRLEQALFSLQH